MKFKIQRSDSWSNARAARMELASGQIVETPIFMPVATQAVFRGVDAAVVEQLDYQVILANTFHLLLRPGPQLFESVGGIHKFMHWPRAVLTDSGGFQIFSLSKSLKLSEEGAKFKSYVDGSEVMLTPESSIAMQQAIGSDIMMVLDHCIDSTSDRASTIAALELTTRWAKRSFAARPPGSKQALFGIVQGACFKDLRKLSAQQITDIPFDGFALGGLAVGETRAEREDTVEFAAPLLPSDKPRYLMGVGTPLDLLEAVKRGIDMFDCILPTNLAHQGVAFTSTGRIDLRRSLYRNLQDKLDPDCACSTCARFSRAYLHHLRRTDEHVGHQLLSVHNLTFYRSLMRGMRESILDGRFKEFYEITKPRLLESDTVNPGKPPAPRTEPKMELGNYEVVVSLNLEVTDRLGKPKRIGSIRQKSSGEVMHSVSDPSVEARSLYLEQAEIVKLAQQTRAPDEASEKLLIWDVGLGAATNAMTTILELESQASLTRAVEIVSFENDLDPLRLALKYPSLFAHLRHRAPVELLKNGEWLSDKHSISWRLNQGDFEQLVTSSLQTNSLQFKLGSEPCKRHVIWFDPFSSKVNSKLWTTDFFRSLLGVCVNYHTSLYTYTASTAVRAALLAAGWFVGIGRSTGLKRETSIAYNKVAFDTLEAKANLLSGAWLRKWERSDAKQPFGSDGEGALEAVKSHPQFSIF